MNPKRKVSEFIFAMTLSLIVTFAWQYGYEGWVMGTIVFILLID